MSISISVVIPLYNKASSIERALCSVLNQSLLPLEIIIIDDGSTDKGAEIARGINSPLIKLVSQQNQGVSAARNHGAELALGDYLAFLDADDYWHDDYLRNMAKLIEEYPNCGLYTSNITIDKGGKHLKTKNLLSSGVLDNFFSAVFSQHICLPSCAIIPRDIFQAVKGFPLGMKLGEDQFLWMKIALEHKVCFCDEPLVYYSVKAENKSNSIFTKELTAFSFKDYYQKDNSSLNEYIARCELGRALIFSQKGDLASAKEVEKFYAYTKLSRRNYCLLAFINKMPRCMRGKIVGFYSFLTKLIKNKYV